jgi:hypothetical protein
MSREITVNIHDILRLVNFGATQLDLVLRNTLWLGVEVLVISANSEIEINDDDVTLFIDVMLSRLQAAGDLTSKEEYDNYATNTRRNIAIWRQGFPYQDNFLEIIKGGK